MDKVQKLIKDSADFLYRERICSEDGISHNGRRAYALTLLSWLEKKSLGHENITKISKILEDLDINIKKNQRGDSVIYPGLHHRRNYSTNAIDCGIAVDAFYDSWDLVELSSSLEKKIQNISKFLARKIKNERDCHNQYLWAATGLANFVKNNSDEKYRKLLEETVEYWTNLHDEHGYSSYIESDEHLNGLTPYYFSRCIAFAFYILEKSSINRPDIEEKLFKASEFLGRLLRSDGTKEMSLEVKRYYFWDEEEVGSHPYDIYVFGKMYQRTKDEFWLRVATNSLNKLIKSEYNKNDWQCRTMTAGHIAWLSKIPDDFLNKISKGEPRPLVLKDDLLKKEGRVFVVGDGSNWNHFVTKKSPINGFSGERCSGLVINSINNINNLTKKYPYHHRRLGNPFIFLRHSLSAIKSTIKQTMYHSWDSLFYKKNPRQSWGFLKDSFLGYLWTGLFIRSTEFVTEISNLDIDENSLKYDLVVSDLNGKQSKLIGERVIDWGGSELKIKDKILD